MRKNVGEQISGNQFLRSNGRTNAGSKKWIKRQGSRKMRRWAKRDPEGAPRKRPVWGWVD